MKTITGLIVVAGSMFVAQCDAAEGKGWRSWEHDLKQVCPSHHVAWVEDGLYEDLVNAFEGTLSEKANSDIERVADFEHKCAGVASQSVCLAVVHMDAYQHLGLLTRFVRYGCREVRCEEVALCSKFPGHAK